MNSITTFSKNTILKVKIAAMMLLILLASIWFALNSQPVKHYAPSNPGYEVMKRESLSLDEALNKSLAYGDYRRVNVDWGQVA